LVLPIAMQGLVSTAVGRLAVAGPGMAFPPDWLWRTSSQRPGAAAWTQSAAVLRVNKQGDRGAREGLGNSYPDGVRLGPR